MRQKDLNIIFNTWSGRPEWIQNFTKQYTWSAFWSAKLLEA